MSAQTSNPSLVENENEKGNVAYSPNVDEGRLLRKLDRNLLPILIVLYLLSFLDRSNSKDKSFICILDIVLIIYSW